MARRYVPCTLDWLRAVRLAGEMPVPPEAVVPGADTEEAEYDALMTAAQASAALLDGPGRRVVVVVDLPDPTPSDRVDRPVPWRRVVAVHADPHERDPDADPDDDLAWYATQEVDAELLG